MIASTVALMEALLLLLLFKVSYLAAVIGGVVTTTAGGAGAGGGVAMSTAENPESMHAERVSTTTASAAGLRAVESFMHPTVWGAGQDARALLAASLDEDSLEVVSFGGGVGVAERLTTELEAVVVR